MLAQCEFAGEEQCIPKKYATRSHGVQPGTYRFHNGRVPRV
jgi:hypothetical protein